MRWLPRPKRHVRTLFVRCVASRATNKPVWPFLTPGRPFLGAAAIKKERSWGPARYLMQVRC